MLARHVGLRKQATPDGIFFAMLADMTIDAIALLPISIHALTDVMRVEHEEAGTIHFRVVGRTLRATPVEGGTKVALGMRFDTPPATLGTLLRRDFGALIEELSRVYVYPSVAKPEADTYAGILEEVGEGGEWLELPEDDEGVGPSDAMGVFQGLASGLGPDMMGQMQKMMSDPDAMGQLAQLAQGLMADEGMRSMMEDVAKKMQSGEGDIMDSARAMAEKANADNPGMLESLSGLMGQGAPPAASNDDGEDE